LVHVVDSLTEVAFPKWNTSSSSSFLTVAALSVSSNSDIPYVHPLDVISVLAVSITPPRALLHLPVVLLGSETVWARVRKGTSDVPC